MTGRMIIFVGPSGVGKDSVIAALLRKRPEIAWVKRAITRSHDDGSEPQTLMTEDEFRDAKASEAFCMTWQSHGLHYGVPRTVLDQLAMGQDMVANLSRTMLPEARRVFSDMVVFNVTASADTLRVRLEQRGRETPEGIAARLGRADAEIPQGVGVINVSNDGALEDTLAVVLGHLYPEKV